MKVGPIVAESIDRLETAVGILTRHIERPLFIAEEDRPRFRFATRNSQVIQVLKAVRVVSGFHAYVHLLGGGFTQEAGVIIRSVYECLEDIQFLDEAQSSSAPTSGQREFQDNFFAEGDFVVDDFLAGRVEPHKRATRREKRAAVARLLGTFSSPEITRRRLEAIAGGLDGYVHAAYPHIMELYSATTQNEGFHMRGMPQRIDEMVRYLASIVHLALNCVAKLLLDTNYHREADELLDIRKKLETSREYR